MRRLIDAADALTRFPRMGHVLRGAQIELRDLIVDDYHLVYEMKGDTVRLLTVLHGAQDIEASLTRLGYPPN